MTAVAYWQVVGQDVARDRAVLEGVRTAAVGELRLQAHRLGGRAVGEPRRVEVPLYLVPAHEPDGLPHLEPASWLRVAGLDVPDRPDGILVRWEQDMERRAPALPRPRRGRRT